MKKNKNTKQETYNLVHAYLHPLLNFIYQHEHSNNIDARTDRMAVELTEALHVTLFKKNKLLE